MAGDPADVGRAPVNIIFLGLEDILEGIGRIDHVAAAGMEDALGLARGAGGVEDEERIFAVGFDCRALSLHAFDFIVPPLVLWSHFTGAACSAEDQCCFNGGAFFQGLVNDCFEGNGFIAAHEFIGRDDHFTGAVVDAVGQGAGGEAGEDDGVDGADAGAGQEGEDGFGHHGHVEAYAVAFRDADLAQHIGRFADFGK